MRQHRILDAYPRRRILRRPWKRDGLEGVASTFTSDKLILNGAGEFAIGGPEGDNGLSGKKLVIDHYGPSVPIGGGALSGKDPTRWTSAARCEPASGRRNSFARESMKPG